MPVITFKNVDRDIVIKTSNDLADILASTVVVDKDRLNFEYNSSELFLDGEKKQDTCIVTIKMINRGDQVKTVMATIINEYFKTKHNMSCAIHFEDLAKENYYIDGIRFDKQ